jgi:hypothetical protein
MALEIKGKEGSQPIYGISHRAFRRSHQTNWMKLQIPSEEEIHSQLAIHMVRGNVIKNAL